MFSLNTPASQYINLVTFQLLSKCGNLISRNGTVTKQTQCLTNRILGTSSANSTPTHKTNGSRQYHEVTGDVICPSMVQGIDHLRDPRLNKVRSGIVNSLEYRIKLNCIFQGLAFTLEERQVLGIHGLQPARFKTQEEQLELCKISINRYQEDLNKYLYLVDLQVIVIL